MKSIEIKFTNPETEEFAIWCVPQGLSICEIARMLEVQEAVYDRSKVSLLDSDGSEVELGFPRCKGKSFRT